jgi:hypothetical protein
LPPTRQLVNKEKIMSLPLPLQLNKPVLLAGDLAEGIYDPKTQTCGSFTASSACSNSVNFLTGIAVDVQVDSVVDDNL